jgi:chromosomal replication initiator protein
VDNIQLLNIWKDILVSISGDPSIPNPDLWLSPDQVKPVRLEEDRVIIEVPNKFFMEWIKNTAQRKIESLLSQKLSREFILDYEVSKAITEIPTPPEPIADHLPQSDFSPSDFNPRYTFDTFIIGNSNRFAHATAEAVTKNPGRQFNPFFIYGGVGLGKTHLLHAIGYSILKSRPNSKVLYTTSEQFMNEFINSLRSNSPDSFRSKFRNLDCLLIDDIQFLIGKAHSEEEFVHTFNSLHGVHKQLVIASDRSPKDMAPSEQRLISRFEWGVVADIKPPDLETRIAILRRKMEFERFHVPEDVILFIASAIKSNIRTLEGALISLKSVSAMTGVNLTVELAKEFLKNILEVSQDSVVQIETIQKVVSEKYSTSIHDMKSKTRVSEVAFPRQIAIYLSCTMTERSTTEIGKAFGGRDHTTVIHARNKIKDLLEKDIILLGSIKEMTEQIRSVENLMESRS